MKYKVFWEEWVYDGFDVIDSINDMSQFSVEAETKEEAEKLAYTRAREEIDKIRPDKSHGMFIPTVIYLTDELGKNYRLNKRSRIADYNTIVSYDD